MKLPRYSIASILAVIAIVAVALAALRTPSYLWANVTSTLALVALFVATINMIFGRGAGRAYWIGFLLCGGSYFAVSSVPGLRDSICPRLVTEVALDLLYPYISPPSQTLNWTAVVSTAGPNGTLTTIGNGTAGPFTVYYTNPYPAAPGSPNPVVVNQIPTSQWAAWTEPDRSVGVGYLIGTVPLCSSEACRRIGHAMFTLLVAVLGGAYSRHRYRKGIIGRTTVGSTLPA